MTFASVPAPADDGVAQSKPPVAVLTFIRSRRKYADAKPVAAKASDGSIWAAILKSSAITKTIRFAGRSCQRKIRFLTITELSYHSIRKHKHHARRFNPPEREQLLWKKLLYFLLTGITAFG
jgi:hypothetical protein